MDDRGIDRVEFLLGGKPIAEQRPAAHASTRARPRASWISSGSSPGAGTERARGVRVRRSRARAQPDLRDHPPAPLLRDRALPARRLRGGPRPRRGRLRRPARAAAAGAAAPLQPLHRGRPRAGRRDVLRAGEAHRAHPERAPPQQPDDHGRAADREDDVPVPPEEGPAADEELGDYRFFPIFVDLQGVPEQGFFHALMGDVVDELGLLPTPAPRCATPPRSRTTTAATSATTCSACSRSSRRARPGR